MTPTHRRARSTWLLATLLLGACGSQPAPSAAAPSPSVVAASPASAAPFTGGTILSAKLAGRIVWSTETDARSSADVYTAAVRDGAVEAVARLTDRAAEEFDGDLSPDGRQVAFRANPDPASDHADLWTVGIDGGAARNLTGHPSLDNWSPAWSPDGTRIAFASTRAGGTLCVWTMAADGGDPRRVTRGHGEYPDWSPDGREIVYAAPPGGRGQYDLWRIAADGNGEPIRITTSPATDFAPAWSPDGRWIAYQADTGSRWELWIIRPDGSDAHRVSPAGADGVWAAWTPAGLLAWSGPAGISVLDVDDGRTATIRMTGSGGPEFLSWGRLVPGS
jgi:Tol biopolymer transport system component